MVSNGTLKSPQIEGAPGSQLEESNLAPGGRAGCFVVWVCRTTYFAPCDHPGLLQPDATREGCEQLYSSEMSVGQGVQWLCMLFGWARVSVRQSGRVGSTQLLVAGFIHTPIHALPDVQRGDRSRRMGGAGDGCPGGGETRWSVYECSGSVKLVHG